jgi:hypothetical protein
LVDVSAIPKIHVSLSGRLPLWYLDLWLNRLWSICSNSIANHTESGTTWLHCLLGRMACLPTDITQIWSTTWGSQPFG